jgi:hypothetical protein
LADWLRVFCVAAQKASLHLNKVGGKRSPRSVETMTGSIGIVGNGVTSARIANIVKSAGVDTRLAHVRNATQLFDCNVVVIASGSPHALLAASFIAQGVHVVSTSDNLADVLSLTDVDDVAKKHNSIVVAGAACSPGMSGLLVSHMSRAFQSIDEVHTAVHGTGGPMCARQHHDSLGGISVGWHDGEWLQRPAGSGRELCWFPHPVGARDCYRFASPEPVLMQRMAPELQRITARISATRRDRLTARLPMLRKPHAEGLDGALRVEVRGLRHERRHVEIVGIVDRVATVAGAVAAHTAIALTKSFVPAGVYTLGQAALPNADILDGVISSGIELHQFVGN